MEEIKITKSKEKDTFFLEVGDKIAEELGYDEMLGLVSSLTMQSLGTCKPCMGYLHKKEETYVPKDGDFVTFVAYVSDIKFTAICKEYNNYNLYYYAGTVGRERDVIFLHRAYNLDSRDFVRPATEKEKQELLSKLHEKGKDWDAEKKEIVEYKWRPEISETYWTIYFDNDKWKFDTILLHWLNTKNDILQFERNLVFNNFVKAAKESEKRNKLLEGE